MSPKVKFIHTNLYQIHPDRPAAAAVETPSTPVKNTSENFSQNFSRILKGNEMVSVAEYEAPKFMNPSTALETLKQNFRTLTAYNEKLKFLLEELEELS